MVMEIHTVKHKPFLYIGGRGGGGGGGGGGVVISATCMVIYMYGPCSQVHLTAFQLTDAH